MPSENVKHACGSRSTRSTRRPSSRSATPSDATVVVFATPPFWFATASVRVIAPLCLTADGSGSGVSELKVKRQRVLTGS